MFIYVFSESDCNKMLQAGFQYLREDKDMEAFIFVADSTGEHVIPGAIESVVTSRMTFHGTTGNK